MENDHLPDLTVQRRSRLHSGHASTIKLQRIHVSGDQEGGCGGLES